MKLCESSLFAAALVSSCLALSCAPCGDFSCDDEGLICETGYTTDVCGCCRVCRKAEGEDCGGPWGILGECPEGLICNAARHSDGKCVRPTVSYVDSRWKRSLSRLGKAKLHGTVHRHTAYGDIPEYIKNLLKEKGYQI